VRAHGIGIDACSGELRVAVKCEVDNLATVVDGGLTGSRPNWRKDERQ